MKSGKTKELKQGRADRSSLWSWIGLAVVILFVIIVRVRLLSIPLERDEGEFAYMGQLMLSGEPPYLHAYDMKFPGIYAAYALIMAVFGQTIQGIHVGFLLVNLGAIVLLFLLARRLLNPLAAVVASAVYAVMSASPSMLGTSAHATHFVVLFALGGILTLVEAPDRDRLSPFCWSGLLLGISYTMKQPGVFFVLFGLVYLIARERRLRLGAWRSVAAKAVAFTACALAPFAVICLSLLAVGVFSNFWFWTFSYAREYGSAVPLVMAPRQFWVSASYVFAVFIPVLALAGIGLFSRQSRLFLIGFLLFSFLAVCPGLYFREHYFIVALPAIALLAGAGASEIGRLMGGVPTLRTIVPLVITAAVVGYPLVANRLFLFQLPPRLACRLVYGENPFPESVEIAHYIRSHSKPNDWVAVIGSEPQIYFYSRRRSATGYIYMYPMMEDQKYALAMQVDMIRQITAHPPKFVVTVNIRASWLATPRSRRLVFDWFDKYSAERYRIVGSADILSPVKTVYRWGRDAERTPPTSADFVLVLEREF